MSLDTFIADKQDIHTLTTPPDHDAVHSRPRTPRTTSPPTEQAITDPFNSARKALQEGPQPQQHLYVDVRTRTPPPNVGDKPKPEQLIRSTTAQVGPA